MHEVAVLAGVAWAGACVHALWQAALLVGRAREQLRFLASSGRNGERRVLAKGDLRRGAFYCVILLGNLGAATGHVLGYAPVTLQTAVYAAVATALFGIESALEHRDLERLARERARRDRRASDYAEQVMP
jgi:hypothetical protein